MESVNFCPVELSPYTSEEIAQLDNFARQTGLKLFPVSVSEDGKKPCCKGWLSAATSEPSKLFESCLGHAGRFGMPCKANGFIVIDCDVKDQETRGNGIEQFHAYCEKYGLPVSPVWQNTPSGGRHYFYRADFPEVIRGRTKISLDGLPVNIDIRSPGGRDSDGNYVVSDLSSRSGYEWHGDWSMLPPLPRHLVDELKEKSRIIPSEAVPKGGEVPAHVIKYVENKLTKIARTPEGERNSTLFKQSCKICRWLLPFQGEWEKWEPRILEAALKTGLPLKEAQTTIEQGRKAGTANGPYNPEYYEAKQQKDGFPVLPREAFSDELWDLITALANQCSTSREVALANLLTLGAQCLGYNRSIQIAPGKIQHSNLWTVVISPPGSGKTTCFEVVTKRLRAIQEEMKEEWQEEVKIWEKWQHMSKQEKRAAFENGEEQPTYPRAVGLIAKDTTIEALCEVMGNKPRSVVYYADEMRGFFGSHKRYQANNVGSSNSDQLLPMYDSKPIDIWRKTKDNQNRQIVLERATLTFLGNIQPGLVKKLFSWEDSEQGWPQRCLFIRSPNPKPLLYPPSTLATQQNVDAEIARITDRLWAAGTDVGTTTIDDVCEHYLRPYFECLYYEFLEYPLSKMESFARRFYWTSFRIMHVLAFLEWAVSSKQDIPSKLGAKDAYRGVSFCRWLMTNTVSVFLGSNKDWVNGEMGLKRSIAQIVVDHEREIHGEVGKVPSSVFRAWLQEAGHGQADQYFTKPLASLGITAGKARKDGASVNVKIFPDAALELCRKMARPLPLLFERLNDLTPPETQPEMDAPETVASIPSVATVVVTQPAAPVAPVTGSETPHLDFSNPYGFTHLHLHTEASFLDAILTSYDAIAQAKKCNMTSLAITDHGNLHNAHKFYLAAKAAGIHPVLGCEIYLKNDGLFPPPPDGKKAKASFHLTLLAENREGWKNLLAIQNHSFDNQHNNFPLVSHDFLASHSRGLIGMSACLGGEIPQAILQGHDPKPLVEWYQKVFGENSFFFERMENGYPELQRVNAMLGVLSWQSGVPMVATSDVHYLAPEDREAYLVNSMRDWQIKNGETVAERGRGTWMLHFRTAEEMRIAHENRTEELELAGKIAARCDVELPDPEKGKYFMPSSAAIVGTEKASAEVLKEKALAGLSARGLDDKTEYKERLDYELGIISQKGFENYILMIADMIEEARRKSITVGPGRGSAAGSLVCYALGITQLDPVENGLLFERFINPDRVSLPDIDVDYDEERRGEILDYLRTKYGAECVTAIGTIGTRKGKAAINDVVRNLQNDRPEGMPQKEWTELGKKLASCVPDQSKQTIGELEESGAFSKFESPETSRILKIASRLEGLSRQAGQHACGYVVAPHALETAIPLRRTVKNGPIVTQWTKDEIEAAGYVKLDALGSLTLTRIRKTLEKIKAAGKPEPSFSLTDNQTYDLFKSGETAGIFQMTSDGIKSLVRKVNPESLQDLAVAIALYRPGPLNSGMIEHYLKRRNGKEEVSYFGLDDKLRPILEETCGVIVYQEQVMRIAQAIAGFSAVEADVLRAAMGKKKMDIMTEKKGQFIIGAMQNGIDEAKATEIFTMMEKFAEYGFNKSHAESYALVAYQTAFLKAHYPAEFLAACCETMDDNLTPRGIASECARLGINPKSLPTICDLSGFGSHPLEAYGAKGEGVANVADLTQGQQATVRVYAENVRETTVSRGKSAGQKMGMGKLSDESGSLPFVAFPEAWSNGKIKQGKCYCLTGFIQRTRDKLLQLVVQRADLLLQPV